MPVCARSRANRDLLYITDRFKSSGSHVVDMCFEVEHPEDAIGSRSGVAPAASPTA